VPPPEDGRKERRSGALQHSRRAASQPPCAQMSHRCPHASASQPAAHRLANGALPTRQHQQESTQMNSHIDERQYHFPKMRENVPNPRARYRRTYTRIAVREQGHTSPARQRTSPPHQPQRKESSCGSEGGEYPNAPARHRCTRQHTGAPTRNLRRAAASTLYPPPRSPAQRTQPIRPPASQQKERRLGQAIPPSTPHPTKAQVSIRSRAPGRSRRLHHASRPMRVPRIPRKEGLGSGRTAVAPALLPALQRK
jgi:hypothetical protein